MSEARAAELRARVERAIASGDYLAVLPQFVVRGAVGRVRAGRVRC